MKTIVNVLSNLLANAFDLDGSEPQLAAEGEKTDCFETCPTCSSEEVNALILRDQYPKGIELCTVMPLNFFPDAQPETKIFVVACKIQAKL